MQVNPILILTGDIQSGKTTFLQHWVKQRNDTAGWLSPVIDGERFFYNIPEQVLYNMEALAGEKEVLKVGKFIFSAAIFLKVSETLIAWSNEKEWKYIIIDEIGPLELDLQEGLFNALIHAVQKAGASFTLILVIRKNLLDKGIEFCKQQNREARIIHLNKINESVWQELK